MQLQTACEDHLRSPKAPCQFAKHKLDLTDVEEDFFAGAIVLPAQGGRYKALGLLGGKAVAVIFKPVGSEAFAIISLRPASKKEREQL